MSDVVIASNITTKISARININTQITTAQSNTVLYTVPANSYAILNFEILILSGSGSRTIKTQSGITVANETEIRRYGVYFGPNEIIYLNSSVPGTVNYLVSGVEFINSP